VVLATVELNDLDLGVAAMINDFRGYPGAFDQRRSYDYVITAEHQNPVELDDVARRCFELLKLEGLALPDAVLLTTAFYYRIHR
jgi:hypothetical protein